MPTTTYITQRLVSADGVRPGCLVVDDRTGKIVEIADIPPSGTTVIECGEGALLPGLIDTHVHVNEPGRTDWEGFRTATEAAAAGGITTLIDMPLNNLPETTTVAALERKRAAAKGTCRIDWRAWGGAVNGNQAHLLALAAAGVAGFKCFLLYPGCDGMGLIDQANLRSAMPLIAKTGLPLLVHAELAGPCDAAAALLDKADWRSYETYLRSRPDEAELDAIAMMIALCREFGTLVHIVHLSSAQALPLLRAARAEGLPITVETCPHYVAFAAEEITDGATLLKCAPPIRSRANGELLWNALRDGTIDLVASDHSPCPPEMKGQEHGSFQTAWGGIASLSLGLSVMATEAAARGFGLHDLVRWMGTATAKLGGLTGVKGGLAAGFDADFIVFAPEETFTVTEERLHFRHKVSPYLGRELRGMVRKTFVRGQCVFDEGDFPGPCLGREVIV